MHSHRTVLHKYIYVFEYTTVYFLCANAILALVLAIKGHVLIGGGIEELYC